MTPTAPTPMNRRNAGKRALNDILLLDDGLTALDTAFLGVLLPRPWKAEYADNAYIKRNLLSVLKFMVDNVQSMPDTGTRYEVANVMKDNPRRSTRPKHLRGGRKKKLMKPGDRK